ncbi:hypothetical protein [uncultured Pedobacter sp.]|uniref:hypothetical protein n=1 Tax=uncultured Pedobacter sp. TaxID=246139 RepID=UPI0026005F7D|nr:hypothetical protein [uncultured Pedobacter sp.]
MRTKKRKSRNLPTVKYSIKEKLQANTAGHAVNNTTITLLNKNDGNLLNFCLMQPGIKRRRRLIVAVNIMPE